MLGGRRPWKASIRKSDASLRHILMICDDDDDRRTRRDDAVVVILLKTTTASYRSRHTDNLLEQGKQNLNLAVMSVTSHRECNERDGLLFLGVDWPSNLGDTVHWTQYFL